MAVIDDNRGLAARIMQVFPAWLVLGGSGLPARPVLEINPQHPLVDRLHRYADDPELADWAHVLYNQAVLTLGARIDEPAVFVDQLNNLLVALSQREIRAEARKPVKRESQAE